MDFGCAMGEAKSMGTLFQKPKKTIPVSPIGDNKQFHEVKSLSKAVSNNREQKVGKVLKTKQSNDAVSKNLGKQTNKIV